MEKQYKEMEKMAEQMKSSFLKEIVKNFDPSKDIAEQYDLIKPVIFENMEKTIAEQLKTAEMVIAIKTRKFYGEYKQCLYEKLSEMEQELAEEIEKNKEIETEIEKKFKIIPEADIPDKVKINEIIEFFKKNADKLNGVEFTKNKFAICIREGICPKIPESSNKRNVLYNREHILCYIMAQFLLNSIPHSEIAELFKTFVHSNENVYVKYCEFIDGLNLGYEQLYPVFKEMLDNVPVEGKELDKTISDFKLSMYVQLAGNIEAIKALDNETKDIKLYEKSDF